MQIEPMLIAIPDGGGGIYSVTEYWNSIVNGNYGDYIINDLVNWITEEYPIMKSSQDQHYREYWLIGGFSMGANGCSRLALKYHEVFSGFASFSGELSSERYRDWFAYINQVENPDYNYAPPNANQLYTYVLWGTASVLSPDTTAPYKAQFPLEEGTGAIRESVFNLWLQSSPVTLADEYFNKLGNSSNSMDILVRVGRNEPYRSYFEFSKDFSDSLNSWGIYHDFGSHYFGHSFNEELASQLLFWADAHFAQRLNLQHDLKPIHSLENLSSINAYSNFNPMVFVRNVGSETETNFKVECQIDKNGIQAYYDTETVDTLKSLEIKNLNFKNWCPSEVTNYNLIFYTSLSNDEYVLNDTLKSKFSATELVDDFESGFKKWESNGSWGLIDKCGYSGNFGLNSNPEGTYENNLNSWVEYRFSLNLSSLETAYLSFWTKYEIEQDADIGYIEICSDGGQTWDRLNSVYSGSQDQWKNELISLKEYCGSGFNDVRIRFHLVTDSEQDKPMLGWFLDHIVVGAIRFQHDVDIVSLPKDFEQVPVLANFIPITIVRNLGKEDESNIMVTCQIDTGGTVIYSDEQTIDMVKSLDSKQVAFNKWSSPEIRNYNFSIFTSQANDENKCNDTLLYRMETTNFVDDFESDMNNWNSDSGWGTSTMFVHSGTSSLCDSPEGVYQNNMDSWASYKLSIDLSQVEAAHISYWTCYFIQQDHDFGYVEISTDNGSTWNQLGEDYTGVQASWTKEGRSLTAYCGSGFNEVWIRFHFVSDDNVSLLGWFLDDIEIYAGELQTDVANQKITQLPEKFVLHPNYPNPFNPSTTIQFAIPKSSKVTLKIIDMLGREVATLVDEKLLPGEHKVIFDSKELPSGVYFYRLQAEEFTATKKLLLLK